jgi:hypothetical protein
VADSRDSGAARQPGWREVLLVAAAVVGIVLLIAAIGTFVPPAEAFFNRIPVAIIVLLAGTAWVLWRIARRPGNP